MESEGRGWDIQRENNVYRLADTIEIKLNRDKTLEGQFEITLIF